MSENRSLAKECGCVTHIGPHWLHMFLYDKRVHSQKIATLNERVRERGDVGAQLGAAALAEHIAQEGVRIYGEMAEEMKRRGLERIPADLIESMEAYRLDWIAKRRRHLQRQARAQAREAEGRLADLAAEYETATGDRRRAIEAETAEIQQQLRQDAPHAA